MLITLNISVNRTPSPRKKTDSRRQSQKMKVLFAIADASSEVKGTAQYVFLHMTSINNENSNCNKSSELKNRYMYSVSLIS